MATTVRRPSSVLALLLLALLIGLTPAAYAEPVDPLWIAGFTGITTISITS